MKRFVLAVILLAVFSVQVIAAPADKDGRANEPITIKSNELSTDTKKGTATFIGKVIARQGNLTIYADRLVVYYRQEGGEVDRVEVVGNVRIVQDNRLATAREGVYFNKEQKIVLTGDPKVLQGNDVVSGKSITYFVEEQKSVVTGGADTRVEAVIHPKEKSKDGGAKR